MDRQHAHKLLDELEPGQFEAVVRLLEVMTNPEAAPIDNEPTTDEEERAVTASKEWFRKNKGIPFEDVVADLGFSMEEIRGDKGSA